MHLAILFAVDFGGSNETFTLSREVDTDDPIEVAKYMMKEAGITNEENVDTILLLRNGNSSPEVVHHWSAKNGDF